MTTYRDFTQAIRRFKRDDLLATCASFAWQAWEIEDSRGYSNKERQQLITARAFSPRIFSVAAAAGNNFRSRVAGDPDFFWLGGLYLGINSAVSDEKFIDLEMQEIQGLCGETKYLKNHKIDSSILLTSTKSLFMQRSMRSQWDTKAYTFRHIIRAWLILKYLDGRLGNSVFPVIERMFRMDPVDAFRSACGIYFLATGKDKFPGIFDIQSSTCQREITEKYGVDLETVNFMSNRVSAELKDFRNWHDAEVLGLGEYYKKYAPIPLYRTPLVRAQEIWLTRDEAVSESTYLCPSPHILMHTLSDMFSLSLRENRCLLGGVNVDSAYGYAVEDYLELSVLPQFFDPGKVQRLDTGTGRHKVADFIVETEHAWFVIESKKSLSSSFGRSVSDPLSVVSIWDRLLESYGQCSETIKTISDNSKPKIALVVVGEDILFEQGIFDLLAFRSGIFRELNLEFVEVMSLESFERCFQFGTVEDVVSAIVKKWGYAKSNPGIDAFYSLQVMRRGDGPGRNLKHLNDCFEELFPGLEHEG